MKKEQIEIEIKQKLENVFKQKFFVEMLTINEGNFIVEVSNNERVFYDSYISVVESMGLKFQYVTYKNSAVAVFQIPYLLTKEVK